MRAETLLTLLGLIIAAYALLPSERRLDLSIRIRTLDWIIIISAVLLLHYILLYPVLDSLGLTVPLGPWRWGFTPETTSYLVVVAATLVVFVRASRAPLTRRKSETFRRLAEQLLHKGRYSEVLYLLERHAVSLARVSQNKYLLPRLKDLLDPPPWLVHLNALKGQERRSWHPPDWLRPVAPFIPDYRGTQAAAADALHRLLLNETLVSELASEAPYLGPQLLDLDIAQRMDFQHLWLSALLDDRRSVLYFEIEHNQNLSAGHRYFYPISNRILHFYFADVQKAETLELYRPIGEYLLTDLDGKAPKHHLNRYNQSLGPFHDTERWRDSTHAVLRLFDFMISESLYQGIQWHMWLHYLPSFVDRFIRNLAPATNVRDTDEWPTPYHYFLYECVSMLRDWIRALRDIPKGSPHVALEKADLFPENANIGKSSVLVLGTVCRKIFETPKVSIQFQTYCLEIALRTLKDLQDVSHLAGYSRLLLTSLANGGSQFGDRTLHHQRIRELVDHIDFPLRIAHGGQLLAAIQE
jgi:hypothetical protein